MFKTKATSPYKWVNFHIWLLELLCGRTLKRNGIKITTQPYEKEEMVFIDTYYLNFGVRKIIINVAVVIALVTLILTLVIYYFAKYNAFSLISSIPILVLMVAFFDNFLPDCIRRSINSLLAKEYERFRSGFKKDIEEQSKKKI